MESTLKKFFGYSEFRPYQKDVIEKILEGRDCLAVMATGSGKSLCYQIPPLLVKKTAIVVSPLVSLMQDQVMSLKQRGIKAEYLGSAQTDHSVQNKAQSGSFDILFMTPEKACNIAVSFWSKLLAVGICLLAVDEAHCISEWGHDFRVEYKRLDKLRDILLNVPFVGLTATATKKVRVDIINSLKMNNPYVSIGSFDRKNLFYGAKHFSRGSQFVNELVQEISKFAERGSSTIVYCTTVKDVEQIFKELQEAGVKAGMYHGQMSSKARENYHRLFIRDELLVLVATVAFGMGIDKPNIRQVIHYGCPKSLESYYQESGRCGRDGLASVCWLYYTPGDFAKADFYCGQIQSANQRKAIVESLMAAQRYCTVTTCRRKFLLEHFGEISPDNCGNCDNCKVSKRERDMSKEAFLLMACILSCRGRWGLNMPIDVLRGSRAKKIVENQFDKLPLHGLGKDRPSNWWKALSYQLISHGYLMETISDTYRLVSVSPKGNEYLKSATPDHQPPLILPLTDELVDEKETTTDDIGELKSLSSLEGHGFSEAEAQVYQMLLADRLKVARKIGTAPYAICGDQTIRKLALIRPSTKARLANIDGVNQHLLKMLGDHLLETIKRISQELNLSLDGAANVETFGERKSSSAEVSVYGNTGRPLAQPNQQRKLTPAKFEAWKMWQEDGLSIPRIANDPGRAAPIKEQTVAEYVLEAAQDGLEISWTRFCDEIGLTKENFAKIQEAIAKVGSTDKLKPIKNELPEDVTYTQIKTLLMMEKCGMVPDMTDNQLNVSQTIERPESKGGSCEADTEITDLVADCGLDSKGEKKASTKRVRDQELHPVDDEPPPASCRKVDTPNESLIAIEATEDSMQDWLKNYDDGVSLSEILSHFAGSKEERVIDLLNGLESDFVVFKKNNLYRLL